MVLFRNGVEVDRREGVSPNIDDHAFVGAYMYGDGYFFSGKIDDARIYSHALSADHVSFLYACGMNCVAAAETNAGEIWHAMITPFGFGEYGNGMATSEVIIQTPDQVDANPKTDFKLKQNYPNPFNPQTRILFSLPTSCQIQINIYDLRGMKVATIIQGFLGQGIHSIIWTGKDDSGKAVSSGTYFYRLTAGDYVETRRMLLVR